MLNVCNCQRHLGPVVQKLDSAIHQIGIWPIEDPGTQRKMLLTSKKGRIFSFLQLEFVVATAGTFRGDDVNKGLETNVRGKALTPEPCNVFSGS